MLRMMKKNKVNRPRNICQGHEMIPPQLAFYVNLHRAVIGLSAPLTGRRRPDIDLLRMLTGPMLGGVYARFDDCRSYVNQI